MDINKSRTELFGIPITTIEEKDGTTVTIERLNDDHAIRMFLDQLLINLFVDEHESALEVLRAYTMVIKQFYEKKENE